MAGMLNLYLDTVLSYTWHQASVLAARVAGHGVKHAHNLCIWICQFLHSGKLPFHRYGTYSILEDEDFAQGLKLHFTELAAKGYIQAHDIVEYVTTLEIKEWLETKAHSILEQTAQCWHFTQKKNGMYINGHEHEDVVEYHNAFMARWKEYEKQLITYDNDGNILSWPTGFLVPQVE